MGFGHWAKGRWDHHAEQVKLHRWRSVAYEADNQNLEIEPYEDDLAPPDSTGAVVGPNGQPRWGVAGVLAAGGLGATGTGGGTVGSPK
jgi:hypothetical protein